MISDQFEKTSNLVNGCFGIRYRNMLYILSDSRGLYVEQRRNLQQYSRSFFPFPVSANLQRYVCISSAPSCSFTLTAWRASCPADLLVSPATAHPPRRVETNHLLAAAPSGPILSLAHRNQIEGTPNTSRGTLLLLRVAKHVILLPRTLQWVCGLWYGCGMWFGRRSGHTGSLRALWMWFDGSWNVRVL